MHKIDNFTSTDLADILSVSKNTLKKWEKNGKLVPVYNCDNRRYEYGVDQITEFSIIRQMMDSNWNTEMQTKALRTYKSIELFAGGGGLALGLEKAGFQAIMLNEIDKNACATLRVNRPDWNVIESDITKIDFKQYHGLIDFVSGGFPCQTFSYAGNQSGFEDTRGTMFFEFARAIKEIQPPLFMAENVRGLLTHDHGRTLKRITDVIHELGYTLVDPQVLKAILYRVPQKRERLILIGIKNEIAEQVTFNWPAPYNKILTLKDALFAGELYPVDVPFSDGQVYPKRKKEIMDLVPQGGYWRDLPIEIQKEYMKKSFYLEGGKTGMARRLSLDEPSLTLTCAPAQNQTERCHPTETRPLTIREYARIQTFPDEWQFVGSTSSQYKQIGNAVPVNLAHAVGRSLIRVLNQIEQFYSTQAHYPPQKNQKKF